jgi:hypothetical protein
MQGGVSWMLADRRRDQASLVVALTAALGVKGASSAMSGWILGRLPPADQQRDA